jgi:hypothetical protein
MKGRPEMDETAGEWGSLAAALAAENIKSAPSILSSDVKEAPASDADMVKNLRAKNVRGWVSPVFSEQIDRTWLDRDKFDSKFNLYATNKD